MFGRVVFVHLHKIQLTKLNPCAIHCVFMGYRGHKKGTVVIIPLLNRLISLCMWLSWNPRSIILHLLPPLLFRGRQQVKRRIGHHCQQCHYQQQHLWHPQPTGPLPTSPLTLLEATLLSEVAPLPEVTTPMSEEAARQLETTATRIVLVVNQDVEASPFSSLYIAPMDDHNPENIPEVSLTFPINIPNSWNYQLCYKHNRGKPLNWYSWDERKSPNIPLPTRCHYINCQNQAKFSYNKYQQIMFRAPWKKH